MYMAMPMAALEEERRRKREKQWKGSGSAAMERHQKCNEHKGLRLTRAKKRRNTASILSWPRFVLEGSSQFSGSCGCVCLSRQHRTLTTSCSCCSKTPQKQQLFGSQKTRLKRPLCSQLAVWYCTHLNLLLYLPPCDALLCWFKEALQERSAAGAAAVDTVLPQTVLCAPS